MAEERYGYGELKQTGVILKTKIPSWLKQAIDRQRGDMSIGKWLEAIIRQSQESDHI
jgi:hypothetical protein